MPRTDGEPFHSEVRILYGRRRSATGKTQHTKHLHGHGSCMSLWRTTAAALSGRRIQRFMLREKPSFMEATETSMRLLGGCHSFGRGVAQLRQ